jgi:hypothetical protein
LQRHPDERVEEPHRVAADGSAHRPAQHHTGDFADDHQRQDQEQRGEQLGARSADLGDQVRRQQHTGHRAQQHTDERQQ